MTRTRSRRRCLVATCRPRRPRRSDLDPPVATVSLINLVDLLYFGVLMLFSAGRHGTAQLSRRVGVGSTSRGWCWSGERAGQVAGGRVRSRLRAAGR